MRLCIELYLDEDTDVLAAKMPCARGFTAVATREAGRLGQDDADQLHYTNAHGYAFVTHNRADVEALSRESFTEGREHAGIIIAAPSARGNSTPPAPHPGCSNSGRHAQCDSLHLTYRCSTCGTVV